MKTIRFFEETWDINVHILNGASEEQLKAYVKKILDDDDEPGSFHAMTYTTPDNVIIALREPFSHTPKHIGLLAHECFHAIAHSFIYRSMPLTPSTEEAYAYSIGSLLRRCLERL